MSSGTWYYHDFANALIGRRTIGAITVAKRHAPYGFSRHAAGGMLHRVARLAIAWRSARPVAFGARWKCSGSNPGSYDVGLTDDPEGHQWCSRCGIDEADIARRRVYVALCPHRDLDDGGLVIKVGRTNHLATRITQIGGQLLGSVPSDHPGGERHLLEVLKPWRLYGREWFSLDCLPAAEEALGIELPLPLEDTPAAPPMGRKREARMGRPRGYMLNEAFLSGVLRHYGITFAECAALAGVSPQHMSAMRHQRAGASSRTVERLAAALDVNSGSLFPELAGDQYTEAVSS